MSESVTVALHIPLFSFFFLSPHLSTTVICTLEPIFIILDFLLLGPHLEYGIYTDDERDFFSFFPFYVKIDKPIFGSHVSSDIVLCHLFVSVTLPCEVVCRCVRNFQFFSFLPCACCNMSKLFFRVRVKNVCIFVRV